MFIIEASVDPSNIFVSIVVGFVSTYVNDPQTLQLCWLPV